MIPALTASSLGLLAAIASTFSWAFGGIMFKRLGEKLDPIGMTWAKSSISALMLGLLLVILRPEWPTWPQLGVLCASGIIGIAVGDSLFFAALNRLSPLALAVLLLAGPDVFAGLLGIVFLHEVPPWQVWAGIGLLLMAIYLVIFPLPETTDQNAAKTTITGIALGLLSLLATAFSMVIAKPVLQDNSALMATFLRLCAGGVMLCAWGTARRRIPIWLTPFRQGEYGLGFLVTVFVVTFGGFCLSLVAVKHIDLVVASALMSLEPVLILPLLAIINKYRPTKREIAGGLLAAGGIVLIAIFVK